MAALSPEWMPSFCPYCGIKFIGLTTNDEPSEYYPEQAIVDAVSERDAAQDAADTMASLVLGEMIDWAFHDDAWRRAIEQLEATSD